MSALIAALYALWCFFVLRQLGSGADARDVFLLVGIMLSAMGFFAEFIGFRLNCRAREDTAEIDERYRRFDESARAKALRLNAHIHRQIGCTGTTDTAMAGSATGAKVIPFPAIGRGTRPHRPLCLRPVAAD